jgi:hypothetical protein
LLKNLSKAIGVAIIVAAVITVATGGAAAPVLIGLMRAKKIVDAVTRVVNMAIDAGKVADGKLGWDEFLLRTKIGPATIAVAATRIASSASKGALSTIVSKVKSGSGAANRVMSAPGEAVRGLFRTAGADATRTTTANVVQTAVRNTVRKVSQKTANDAFRYAIDMYARRKTDKTPWNSFAIPKFYNLVTTGHADPQAASAPARETSSAGGGGGGGGW